MNHLPSLFVSHGAPTYALEPGDSGAVLTQLGASMTRPSAVLVVSPHWMTRNVTVSTTAQPQTVHDFGGFPGELYRLAYPAAGHPELANLTADLLVKAGHAVSRDAQRGLDHGAWVPLMHLLPDADVPAFQVSMPVSLDGASAWQLGADLAPLAAQGVLILGSGSMTHNLGEFRGAATTVAPYVTEFVDWVRDALLAGDRDRLVNTLTRAPHALRAHPTPDHFLPLLVAAGAAAHRAPVTVLPGAVRYGMLSMESYLFGAPTVQ